MDYITTIHQGIRDFVSVFQGNSFLFLYEADIQALLYSILFHKFSAERLSIRGGHHPRDVYGGHDSIQTIPVKCEYPTPRGHESKRGSFDIAVIDPDHLTHYDADRAKANGWKNDTFWNQYVRVGIEIKYYQIGDSLRRLGFDADIEKLRSYSEYSQGRPFLGIAILFIQSDALSYGDLIAANPVLVNQSDPPTGVFQYVVTPTAFHRAAA